MKETSAILDTAGHQGAIRRYLVSNLYFVLMAGVYVGLGLIGFHLQREYQHDRLEERLQEQEIKDSRDHRLHIEREMQEAQSSRIAMEEELKAAGFFRQMIIESSIQTDSAIIIADRYGIIRGCNEATYKLFGYESGELIGKPIEILVAEGFKERHRAAYPKAMERHDMQKRRVTCEGLRKDGSTFEMVAAVESFTAKRDGESYARAVIDPKGTVQEVKNGKASVP